MGPQKVRTYIGFVQYQLVLLRRGIPLFLGSVEPNSKLHLLLTKLPESKIFPKITPLDQCLQFNLLSFLTTWSHVAGTTPLLWSWDSLSAFAGNPTRERDADHGDLYARAIFGIVLLMVTWECLATMS
jgi:hypothetical protein